MENFFAYLRQPISDEEVEIWFNARNMTIEKRSLYGEFVVSLFKIISETYLGDDFDSTVNKLYLTQKQKEDHFDWCWRKTIDNYSKENIKFKLNGEHKEYLKLFFEEVFYEQNNQEIVKNLPKFLDHLFDETTPFSESDLDMITDIYMVFEKSYI
jgi:hypothetical protein